MSRTARSLSAKPLTVRGPAPTFTSPKLRRRSSAAKKKASKTEKELPVWAKERIFDHAKTVLWEGTAVPLRASRVAPEKNAFVSHLPIHGSDASEWSDLVHPIDRRRVSAFFETCSDRPAPSALEYRIIDSQGSVVWIRHTVESISTRGKTVSIKGFVTDIQAEKDYQLESLRVSEREQNRIGQDLHDDLCQVLAGLSCLMRVFEGRVATKAPEEVENLKELNQQIVDAMHRTRALTHGLFPGKIQIADIRGALLELASQIKTRFKVAINTQFVGRFPKHSSAQIIQIYRISQEAISNAIKHGRATEIQVRLEAKQTGMELTILDDGAGFPKGETAAPGVGLNIMKYRANLLGGDVAIIDNRSRGVTVQLRYPFETN